MSSPATIVTLGDMTKAQPLLSCFGLLVITVLMARQVSGAILYGIIATVAMGMLTSIGSVPSGIDDFISLSVPEVGPVFLQLDIMGALEFGVVSIITFTMVELFNNMCSLIALLSKANLMDENGNENTHDKNLKKFLFFYFFNIYLIV